jgi:hypothetical protein
MRQALIVILLAAPLLALRPKPEAESAFEKYLAGNDQRVQTELKGEPFLWIDSKPEAQRREVRSGQMAVANLKPESFKLPAALVHHWVATVFVPGVTYRQTIELVTDYDRYAEIHRPYFIASKTLQRNGDDAQILLRLYRKLIIKAAVDTEHVVDYTPLSPTRGHSRTHTVRIQQVDNPGEPDERLRPEGEDMGFLWRHVTYWRFEEREGGTWIQVEALSLSRSLPMGLNLVFGPWFKGVHREFLVHMVAATSRGLMQRYR